MLYILMEKDDGRVGRGEAREKNTITKDPTALLEISIGGGHARYNLYSADVVCLSR